MTMAMPGPGWDNGGYQELVELLRRQVADRLATEGAQELSPAEREQRVARLVDEALDAYTRQRLTARQLPLDPPVEAQVAQAVRDALTGLGPLTPLLADPSITNILITGSTVFVTRTDGSKDRLPPIVSSSQALIDLIRDIAARVGTDERRFDRGVPRVSIRLPDGSRLFATMAVSRHPSVSIHRFTLLNASLDDLCLKYHAMDPGLRDLFTAMVLARKNIIICGGAATGKTTVLRAFAKAIPPTERLITIEDVFELGLDEDPDHPDCVAMQAREPNVEGQGGVDQAELVRWALRRSTSSSIWPGPATGCGWCRVCGRCCTPTAARSSPTRCSNPARTAAPCRPPRSAPTPSTNSSTPGSTPTCSGAGERRCVPCSPCSAPASPPGSG